MDETAVGQPGPSPGLHGAAHLQRELVEVALPVAGLESAFGREPPEIAVGADVVEPVVVDADMRQMRRHPFERSRCVRVPGIAVSPVASNWRTAAPNWKPCVHSVQPRAMYWPSTVKTGEPVLGSHRRSSASIFAADCREQRVDFREQIGGRKRPISQMHKDDADSLNRRLHRFPQISSRSAAIGCRSTV